MRKNPDDAAAPQPAPPSATPKPAAGTLAGRVPEIGGYKGPEPTRYGDWEHNGRCTDF